MTRTVGQREARGAVQSNAALRGDGGIAELTHLTLRMGLLCPEQC